MEALIRSLCQASGGAPPSSRAGVGGTCVKKGGEKKGRWVGASGKEESKAVLKKKEKREIGRGGETEHEKVGR